MKPPYFKMSFRGVGAGVLKVVPMAAISFTTYEVGIGLILIGNCTSDQLQMVVQKVWIISEHCKASITSYAKIQA